MAIEDVNKQGSVRLRAKRRRPINTREMTMSTRFAKVREKVAELTVVRQEGQVLGGGDDD
jgi:hypothetical protein